MSDEPTVPVRPGEEVPLADLERFLADRLGVRGELEARQFPGGYSNLTYLVRVGGQELVMRRPPLGTTVKTAHDMGREFRVLSRLHAVFPRVPRPLVLCDDVSVLGWPFYVMERVAGIILRASLPQGMSWSPVTSTHLAENFVSLLSELHSLDVHATGLSELGRPEGYAERQVWGWGQRFTAAKTEEIPELERTFELLAGNIPTPARTSLLHNDYKYDNLVLDPADAATIRAVLDWEMATVGDPRFDLGTALSYWVEAEDPEELRRFKFGPTDLPGQPTRRELASRYARLSGLNLTDLPYFYAFGLAKTAVIAQQIYFRYVQGSTRDPRFASLPAAIRALGRQASAVLERDSL